MCLWQCYIECHFGQLFCCSVVNLFHFFSFPIIGLVGWRGSAMWCLIGNGNENLRLWPLFPIINGVLHWPIERERERERGERGFGSIKKDLSSNSGQIIIMDRRVPKLTKRWEIVKKSSYRFIVVHSQYQLYQLGTEEVPIWILSIWIDVVLRCCLSHSGLVFFSFVQSYS